MFKLEKMEPVPQSFLEDCYRDENGNFNPFHYDLFNMGRHFDKDIMFMFRSHDTEKYTDGYFINTKTGERQRLILKEIK